ncbi:carbohydrate sulfotransferase 15-like [Ruditapes philippinarum]|uniref:carbohydrate sulfotransferase 15-like n=1 Tax=Ruditapes philippinarum TaxID=129788 RepID=UPI00295BA33A|nr:carbohydrate sulfotransferase 15-like [Ruditapes philippinarum]
MSSFIGYVPSPEDFHTTVVYRIRNFTSCRQHRKLRACAYDVYDDWNIHTYKVRLSVGMYSIFLDDWLKVFPRHNVLVVKSEDTRGRNERSTFKKILQFLGLIMPTRKYISEINSERTYNNQRNADSKPMLTKTKLMLHEFYKAFNRDLQILLPHIQY